MAFMTSRDRIAVAVIMTLIVTGWGIRYFRDIPERTSVTVYRNAIDLPAVFEVNSADAVEDVFAPIDINTATSDELMQLPMIGEVKANAIIEYRTSHGGFAHIDELVEVPGIGPATLERIRDDITVKGDTGATVSVPAESTNEK